MQHTLARTVTLNGTGLHSGEMVQVSVHPAPADHGVVFQRTDLAGRPVLPAKAEYSRPTPLCTTLMGDDGVVFIRTIEHLLSAMMASGIDNAMVSVLGPEIPLLDGSAKPFFDAFKQAGVTRQGRARQIIEILQPIEVKDGDRWARLVPDERRAFQMTIDFPHRLIKQQTYRFAFDDGDYERDIAPARTFGFKRDFEALLQAGLIKGGSIESAVVFDEEGVLNDGGLRFADEPARHKLLDAIGDLSLAGAPIQGRYEGYKASHALNTKLVQALLTDTKAWRMVEETAKTKGKTGGNPARGVFAKA